MDHDKLYNKTNEMHFLEFYSDYILYMFRICKLFIFRKAVLLYKQFMVCIVHSCGIAATTIELQKDYDEVKLYYLRNLALRIVLLSILPQKSIQLGRGSS